MEEWVLAITREWMDRLHGITDQQLQSTDKKFTDHRLQSSLASSNRPTDAKCGKVLHNERAIQLALNCLG